MKQSLRTLLAGIIDYAGTFPPARLPVEETVRRYVQFCCGDLAWMLGKLVCAFEALPRMLELLDVEARNEPKLKAPLALVIPSDSSAYLEQLEQTLRSEEVTQLLQRHAPRVEIESLELKLGRSNVTCLHPTPGYAVVFHELPSGEAWLHGAKAFFKRILDLQDRSASEQPAPTGFKLRTGGLGAAAFPSVKDVAWVIAQCRDLRVPWKATAGLHHPLRHFDESLGTMMHGFLNVASAAVLADVHRLDEIAIAEILRDESIESFAFRDDGLRWRDLRANNDQIAACRANGFQAFGSCSFDEPIEDLKKLGLL